MATIKANPPRKATVPKNLMTKPPTDITDPSLPFRGFSSCSVMSSDHRQTEMLA
jgi:hypothetical protein